MRWWILLVLGGCAQGRVVPLSTGAARPELWMPQLAACAKARGYAVDQLDHRTDVDLGDSSGLAYVARGAALELVVAGAADEVELNATAEIGAELHHCASRELGGAPPRGDRTGHSPCQHLAVCNAALARSFCSEEPTNCPFSFGGKNVREFPRGRRACTQALDRVPRIIEQARAAHPDATLPDECRTSTSY